MNKEKTVWSCRECGNVQAKWSGQCSSCSMWNVFDKELEVKKISSRFQTTKNKIVKPIALSDVKINENSRLFSEITAFDRILGGGLVRGSLNLLGGDPGIGKSTLLLQVTAKYIQKGYLVLYICGEESIEQISLRAQRLKLEAKELLLLAETDLALIKTQIEKAKPDIVIVDSVQVIYKSDLPSLPGSIAQIREVTIQLMYLAKDLDVSVFLIGHVTKSGDIAGPRVLEHLVDGVFYFEGDRQYHYRILRAVKNRFGPCDEIGVFQMKQKGLQEIENPSEVFIDERKLEMNGSAIVPTIEGSCPILIEIQTLVTPLAYSSPSRKSTGIDSNRLALLLAVLEKKVGYALLGCDVFVALAGGIRVQEPGLDLGILLAVASSYREVQLNPHQVIIGEVGLGGNIRRVSFIEKRLKEALRMGFTHALIPKGNIKDLSKELLRSINIHAIEFVTEAIEQCIDQ